MPRQMHARSAEKSCSPRKKNAQVNETKYATPSSLAISCNRRQMREGELRQAKPTRGPRPVFTVENERYRLEEALDAVRRHE